MTTCTGYAIAEFGSHVKLAMLDSSAHYVDSTLGPTYDARRPILGEGFGWGVKVYGGCKHCSSTECNRGTTTF